MAKNAPTGDNARKGAVKKRSQLPNPLFGTFTKRDKNTGEFMDVKQDDKKFKGVRMEKGAAAAKPASKTAKKAAAKKPAAKKPAAKSAAKKPAAKKSAAKKK